MDHEIEDDPRRPSRFLPISRAFGLLLVAVGLLNTIPSIPGFDAFFQDLAGDPNFEIRKFPYEYPYPLAFVPMM